MQVTYPVHTVLQTEAVSIAVNMAKASGYKVANVIKVERTGPSSWDVTVVVM